MVRGLHNNRYHLRNSLRLLADSSRLLTGAADNTARIWDALTGQELAVFPTNTAVRSVSFALGDEKVLVVTDAKMGFSCEMFVYNVRRGAGSRFAFVLL